MKNNQALTMYPLFFDPIYKKAEMKKIDGKDCICYQEDFWGTKVEEDGSVTFTMEAPKAETVEVSGFGGTLGTEKIALEKQANGLFSKNVKGILPGFHYHRWFVDGVQVTNPHAPFAYGCFGANNFFEMPREGQDFWYLKDVPHGWNGKLNFIMDNLIAEGKCKGMIVVMCSGYAFRDDEEAVFFPGDFGRELTEDVIPYMEHTFRVKKGRMHRAMAGLSLGSAQATQIVSRFQNLFGHLGVFSGVRDEETERILAQFAEYPMQTVLMTAGKGEKDLDKKQKIYTDQFEKLGAAGGQRSYEGYHEWHVWRESFRDFASLVFQKEEPEDESEPVFPYEERKLSKEQLDRQTFAEHMLMSDPIHKGLIHAFDEKGRPCGRYREEHPGAEVTDGKTGTARFYLRADGAHDVELNLWGMKSYPMEEGEDGWWTAEVTGIEKGFHYYNYIVNSANTVDCNAPVGYGGFQAVNYLEMPEEDFEEYRIRQVPHGTVHYEYYKSNSTGRTKLCYVYTPAGYEEHLEKRYPVLYLQHGGGENEVGWIWQGKLANIADNLIAKGQMKEMIVVMNTGYAFPENGEYHHSMSAFLQELPESCVPYIDSRYRTIADKDYRALAGLSMGGMQTQRIVFTYPELFGWAGIFSGGLVIRDDEVDYTEVLLNPEAFRKQFHMLFVACGKQEWSYESTVKNEKEVLAAGVPIEVFEGYGYHDWTFWRHCLNAFLRKLF